MNIWTPKCKIIEARNALVLRTKVRGFFKMEAIRPDGRRRMLADWFPNLITDAGLEAIGTLDTWLAACRVGTGSGTPANGDTAMGSQVAGTVTQVGSPISSAQASPPYYGKIELTWRFSTGTAAGNLAEVGIATQAAAGGTQFSRALILDGDGNPTTITVLSDETLDVTYRLEIIPPGSDVNDTVTIGGVDYNTVTRAASVTNVSHWGLENGAVVGGVLSPTAYDGSIGAITTVPTGTTAAASSLSAGSYSASSHRIDTTVTWNLGAANFGGTGITALAWRLGTPSGGMGRMQISINSDDSPAEGIPKTSSDVLSLVLRHSWARGTAI